MKGINRQYQALRGARLARIPLIEAHRPTLADSFLPPDSPAGKRAAPEVTSPASGAAVAIGIDMAADPDLTGICIHVPANVAMFFELLRTEQGLSPDEIFARGVCLVADQIGIAALAKEIALRARGVTQIAAPPVCTSSTAASSIFPIFPEPPATAWELSPDEPALVRQATRQPEDGLCPRRGGAGRRQDRVGYHAGECHDDLALWGEP